MVAVNRQRIEDISDLMNGLEKVFTGSFPIYIAVIPYEGIEKERLDREVASLNRFGRPRYVRILSETELNPAERPTSGFTHDDAYAIVRAYIPRGNSQRTVVIDQSCNELKEDYGCDAGVLVMLTTNRERVPERYRNSKYLTETMMLRPEQVTVPIKNDYTSNLTGLARIRSVVENGGCE